MYMKPMEKLWKTWCLNMAPLIQTNADSRRPRRVPSQEPSPTAGDRPRSERTGPSGADAARRGSEAGRPPARDEQADTPHTFTDSVTGQAGTPRLAEQASSQADKKRNQRAPTNE